MTPACVANWITPMAPAISPSFGNVFILGLLGASDKERNQRASNLVKVGPVTWPMIDARLAYTLANRLDIFEVAQREATGSDLDASPCLFIAELARPICREVGLADLDHVFPTVCDLGPVKL